MVDRFIFYKLVNAAFFLVVVDDDSIRPDPMTNGSIKTYISDRKIVRDLFLIGALCRRSSFDCARGTQPTLEYVHFIIQRALIKPLGNPVRNEEKCDFKIIT